MSTKILPRWLAAAGTALLLSACGGDEETLNAGAGGTQQQATTSALQILTSTPQLPSDGSDSATITVLALDQNNNTLSGEPVTVSASSGRLTGTQTTTDDNGELTRTLEVGPNPKNRTITVTAESGSATASVDVAVRGTTLTIEGPGTVSAGDATDFSAILRDSGGNGIGGETVQISTTSGTLSATSLTTDSSGQVEFDLTTSSDAELTAQALMLTTTQMVASSQANFEIVMPADGAELALMNLPATVEIDWQDAGGSPVDGEDVTFSTTRGSLTPKTATANSGTATTDLDSTSAGTATITAEGTSGGETVTDSVEVEFIATQPDKLTLQADPDTVNPEESSTIRAVVRDANDNPVKGAVVDFTIEQDSTSGG